MKYRLTFKTAFIMGLLVGGLFSSSVLRSQTVIADSTYADGDWSVSVATAFGASEIHEQRLSGGNPDAFRYMEHILPAPPGENDLAMVEVTHINEADPYLVVINEIDHIDYAEDIRLLNLQWNQAFIVSYPALRQSGKLYRAPEFLSVIADTMWRRGAITSLVANDFIALDGSNDKPDFSSGGDFIYFGFWRISTRSGLLPPIPANQNLVYEHGSDNFTVTIHEEPPENRTPTARSDETLYLDYFMNSPAVIPVLENDSDPDGDPIRVLSVDEPAFGGTIVSFNDETITYSIDKPLLLEIEEDFFTYTITDGQESSAPAFVNIYFCICPIECITLFLTPPPGSEAYGINTSSVGASADTLDLELFRRFRDETLLPTETGTRFVDLYYHNVPEVMPLLIFERPDIGGKAFTALQMIQDPVRNLLEEDGGMMITQSLIDTVSVFLDSLLAAVSDSLQDSLHVELARLGPLQELVGLPVAEAVDKAIGDSVATVVDDDRPLAPDDFALEQNFPNPFNASTQIVYRLNQAAEVELTIHNMIGQTIRTLVSEFQQAGTKSVQWDGLDEVGSEMPSGIYVMRFSADDFHQSRKLILMK